jgi:adenylate cyclase
MQTPATTTTDRAPYLFVCYAHDDEPRVYPHIEWLQQQGVELWFDRGIRAGAIWRREIAEALDRATHLLFFISRASLASEHCDREIQYALDHRKTIVPVFIERMTLTPELELALSRVQALDATTLERDALRRRIAVAIRGERAPIRSIAILPLDDISAGADAYFADGLTETLIVELSKLPGLRVISRTSVTQFKGTRTPLAEIAKTLNVEGIIEGSVLRANEQVRVTTQLIDARDDRHLWAQQYDRDATRVLEIHTEVAKAVAKQISLLLTPQDAARFTPAKQVDPRAQAAYFRGLAERSLPLVPNTIQRAITAFEEAIEIAPDWAPPYAALATSIYMYGRIGARRRRVSGHLRARQLARRAIELDPTCGEAHSALGSGLYGYDWDWDGAERELRRGLDLGNSLWSLYPQLLMVLGRTDEAIAQADARVAAAPLDLYIRAERCMILFHVGHFERARLEAQQILASEPDYFVVATFLMYTNMALGRIKDAAAEYARLARDSLAGSELAQLARGNAEPMWRWLETHPARFWNAFGWLMRGDNDRAIAALEAGFREREYEISLLHDAWLAPLRSDPRFVRLVRDMNLPPVKALG